MGCILACRTHALCRLPYPYWSRAGRAICSSGMSCRVFLSVLNPVYSIRYSRVQGLPISAVFLHPKNIIIRRFITARLAVASIRGPLEPLCKPDHTNTHYSRSLQQPIGSTCSVCWCVLVHTAKTSALGQELHSYRRGAGRDRESRCVLVQA